MSNHSFKRPVAYLFASTPNRDSRDVLEQFYNQDLGIPHQVSELVAVYAELQKMGGGLLGNLFQEAVRNARLPAVTAQIRETMRRNGHQVLVFIVGQNDALLRVECADCHKFVEWTFNTYFDDVINGPAYQFRCTNKENIVEVRFATPKTT